MFTLYAFKQPTASGMNPPNLTLCTPWIHILTTKRWPMTHLMSMIAND